MADRRRWQTTTLDELAVVLGYAPTVPEPSEPDVEPDDDDGDLPQ